MKTFLVILGLIVIGLGFYWGWMAVSSHSDAGTTELTISVDKDKIATDTHNALDKVQAPGNASEDDIVPRPRSPRD